MDTPKFLRCLRRYIRAQFPGCEALKISIDMKDGNKIRIPVIGENTTWQLSGTKEKLEENEAKILSVIPEFDKPAASSRKIAKDSKSRYNSYFRSILGSLRKKGRISLDADGYRKCK